MSLEDYRPRITVELRDDQMTELQRILPHGMKKHLFQALVDGVLKLHKEGGHEAIGALISGYISAQQLGSLGIGMSKKEKIAELKYQLHKLEGGG